MLFRDFRDDAFEENGFIGKFGAYIETQLDQYRSIERMKLNSHM